MCYCKSGFKLDGPLCVGNDKISLFYNLMIIFTKKFTKLKKSFKPYTSG